MTFGNLNFLEPSGSLQACNGTALRLSNAEFNINSQLKFYHILYSISYKLKDIYCELRIISKIYK